MKFGETGPLPILPNILKLDELQRCCVNRKIAGDPSGIPAIFLLQAIAYFVTLSSHFTMPNIPPIDTAHTIRNMHQHCQIGIAL